MSKINVNTWEPESGTAATLMATGDTVTVPSGATLAIASGATVTNSGTATGFGDTAALESDIALLGFKVASNGSLSKYNLVDQTEDAFQDQTGIDASISTDEVYNISGKYYTGQIAAPTGGSITPYSAGGTDYTVHSFLSGTTNFAVEKAGTVDYLLVAGGGGGGSGAIPGGGGAGGLLTATGFSLAIGSHPVVVGASGPSNAGAAVVETGGNTTFSTLTAIGGGGGVASGSTGGTGGSGGGGGGYNSGNGGTATVGQGNAGGSGAGGGGSYGAGGGGGAGAVGATAVSPNGGAGGVGLSNSLRTGSGVFYAGGGGGRKWSGSQGAGGNGGGGAGGGVDGTVNTGGGGGGEDGVGGSGIAVIRFVSGALGPTYNQLTLVSNSTTALVAPTKGDIVMTYTNGAGTATLNTDLTAEFSADNGSTWTSTTLAAQGNTGSASPHFIVAAHDVALTSTSGTTMRYRIKTLNQTVSKETRIQAVSLGWS